MALKFTTIEAPASVSVPDDEMLTSSESAAFLKVQEKTMRKWRSEGCGPRYHKFGSRMVRYARRDLIEWREGRKVASTREARSLVGAPAHLRLVA